MGHKISITIVGLLILAGMSSAAIAADADSGKALYEKSCAGCHGADGKGNEKMAKILGERASISSAMKRKRSLTSNSENDCRRCWENAGFQADQRGAKTGFGLCAIPGEVVFNGQTGDQEVSCCIQFALPARGVLCHAPSPCHFFILSMFATS